MQTIGKCKVCGKECEGVVDMCITCFKKNKITKIIMTKGLPACGKSTWAKEYIKNNPNWKRVNKDDLRALIDDGVWSGKNEKFIVKIRDNIVTEALRSGYSIIVDDTNFAPAHELTLSNIAKIFNAEFVVKEFDVPLDVCIERDSKRPNPVGEAVIRRMYNQYINKDAVKSFAKKRDYPIPPKNDSLPKAIIVDIDGTVALLNGRNPYERNVYEDGVNEDVVNLVYAMWRDDYKIIFCSGRMDNKYEATMKWITEKAFISKVPVTNYCEGFKNFSLLMRKTGDNRPDEIVKKEIYENNIKGKYDVRLVVDDRPKVVRMWREVGLICLQLNDVEF